MARPVAVCVRGTGPRTGRVHADGREQGGDELQLSTTGHLGRADALHHPGLALASTRTSAGDVTHVRLADMHIRSTPAVNQFSGDSSVTSSLSMQKLRQSLVSAREHLLKMQDHTKNLGSVPV